MKEKRYYIAYGSNLSVEQMAYPVSYTHLTLPTNSRG